MLILNKVDLPYSDILAEDKFFVLICISVINYTYIVLSIQSFLDPVGIKSPAFSSDSKGTIFNRRAKSDIVLLCESQGYPVPDHR